MNWLMILVLLIIAGNIVWGLYRGFLRVLLSMAGWILIMVFVTFATPYMESALTEHTAIDEHIEKGIHDRLRELVKNGELQSGENGGTDLGLQLPLAIMSKLFDTNEAADKLLEGSGIYDEVAGKTTGLAMRGISAVVILVLALAGYFLLALVFKFVSKLPVIESVNRFFGGLAGFVKGFLLVWLMFAFIAMGSATTVGAVLTDLIYESPLLIGIYENNLILTILMVFF